MTTITCDKCGKKYNSAIKCTGCGNIFQISNSSRWGEKNISVDEKEGAATPSATLSDQISWKNRIQTRISLMLILVTSIILLGFVFYYYAITKSKANDEINGLIKIVATRLSQNLVGPLWGVEESQIEDSLNSEMKQKSIYAILIYDRDTPGFFIGKKRNDENWGVITASDKITGDFITHQVNITRNNESIGRVEVYATMKFLNQELNRSILNIVITAIILNIAIFIAVFISLNKIIIQPVMALTNVAERMSMGDLNAVIGVFTNNEVGLAQAIERMQASLRLAMDRISKK